MTGESTNPERRATRRIPVSLGAVLYYNTLMLPECCVRDLSPEGAFVATSGNFLPEQALLDLAFSVPVAGGVPQRFTAQVMRCTEEGVGVRLRHNDTSSMRNLIETLYAA
ncbi:MAG: PilZ domain-containing protein [Pseudomonadota bacterium]